MSQTGRSCINEATPQENYEININFVKDLSYFFTSPSIKEKKTCDENNFNGKIKIINLATSTRVKG